MTVLHEGFRKKRITKDSERKRILFKGDALFIVPTVKDACITFLWFKNKCSSETDQYFIMRQLVKLILYGISSNKTTYLKKNENLYSSFFFPSE